MTVDDLRAWRARRRWTQTDAAQALGYSLRAYQKIEARHGDLPHRVALALRGFESTEKETINGEEEG